MEQFARRADELVKKAEEVKAQVDEADKRIDRVVEKQKVVMIPLLSFEAECERHDREKTAIRKHYRHVIGWICVITIAFVIAVVIGIAWVLNNFDFYTYSVETKGGDSNFVGNDGDIWNGTPLDLVEIEDGE